jgi:anti-anti-sigma factor
MPVWSLRPKESILRPMELLRVEQEIRGPTTHRLIGELDASNVPQVTARLQDEFRRAGHLTVDTSEITFMDSQGLRMLIVLGEEATQAGTTVMVVNCSKQVKQLLAVAVPTGIPGVRIVDPEK